MDVEKIIPKIIAHRGSSAQLPENTLKAFELAIEQNADIIECDLRITADEHIVIIHDPQINRVTAHKGKVGELQLTQIKNRKINHRDSDIEEEIPTLEELIDLTQGRIKLAFELKDPKFGDPKYAKMLAEIIRLSNMLEHVVFISFNLERLYQIKKELPEVKIGHITFLPLLNISHRVDIECVLWPILFLNPFLVRQAHKLKREVWAMDSIPKNRVRYYLKINVDGILTYSPEQTYKYVSIYSQAQET